MSAVSCAMKEAVRRTGCVIGAGLCAALALALAFMALAVLAQALAVLVLALLSAALLLPHPLKWYAVRAGEAAGAFFDAFLVSLTHAGRADGSEEGAVGTGERRDGGAEKSGSGV